MDILLQKIFEFLEKLIPVISTLAGGYFGYRIGNRNIIMQFKLKTLEKKFDALREIKNVLENLPENIKT